MISYLCFISGTALYFHDSSPEKHTVVKFFYNKKPIFLGTAV